MKNNIKKVIMTIILLGLISISPLSAAGENTNVGSAATPTETKITAPASLYDASVYEMVGYTTEQAAKLSQQKSVEDEAYVTAYLSQMIEAYEYGRDFKLTAENSQINYWKKQLLSSDYPKENKDAMVLKAQYFLRVLKADKSEHAAIWEEFNAVSAGFDSVEAYRAWIVAWEAQIAAQAEQEQAEYEQRIAEHEQQMKESNGGYMGCGPGGP